MKVSILGSEDMKLYMGDVDQYLKIENCPKGEQVQFFNPSAQNTIDVDIQEDGLCPIPSQYLDGSHKGFIKFYIYGDEKTLGEGAFEIKTRQLPSGKLYEES